MMKKIDVIIPVYNDDRIFNFLEKITLNKYRKFISLIIVEASLNKDFIKKIEKYLDDNDNLLVESDNGIFDGFNKGLKLSKNEIVVMLGCDDYFPVDFDFKKVIEDFVKGEKIVFPNIKYFKDDKITRTINYSKYKWWYFFYGVPFYHVGTFIDSSIAKSFSFDLKFPTCADFKYFNNIFLYSKPSLSKIECDVFIEEGGASGSYRTRYFALIHMFIILPIIIKILSPIHFTIRYLFKIKSLKFNENINNRR